MATNASVLVALVSRVQSPFVPSAPWWEEWVAS